MAVTDRVFSFFRGLFNAQRMLNLQDEDLAAAVQAALDRAYAAAHDQTPYTLDLAQDRYVFFSDVHRGAGDNADDFKRTKAAYDLALFYYLQNGYTLVLGGDVEELWENAPDPVIKTYPPTFRMEAQFFQQGRYLRLWGNHDKDWHKPREVAKHLQPSYGDQPVLKVHESVLIRVSDQGQVLGTLFLVHGHQGTLESDYLSWIARPIVRYIWRPFQNLTKKSLNSPAHDWTLARGLDQWLYDWVSPRPKMVLIAGHTHHPVFLSQPDAARLQGHIEVKRSEVALDPANEHLKRQLDELYDRQSWVKTRSPQPAAPVTAPADARKPCYFNTGCCCYSDGTITGLEIVGGLIRLVRWSSQQTEAEPDVLDQASLHDVFARI